MKALDNLIFVFYCLACLLIKPNAKTKLRTTVPETFIYRPKHLLVLPIIISIIITNEKYTYYAFVLLFLCLILVAD